MRIGDTTGPKKRIVFADPLGFSKMEIAFGDYKIKFWPEDLNGACYFCRGTYSGACLLAQRADGASWVLVIGCPRSYLGNRNEIKN